jgi:predicted DCC family thiol-disulfide oxidoreductase YuxK
MPLESYYIGHQDAKLTDEQRKILVDYFKKKKRKLKEKWLFKNQKSWRKNGWGNILYFLTVIAESAISGFSGFLKRERPISFASLQSDFGQQFLTERKLNTEVFNTLYLWKPNHYYLEKSKAVLQIANLLGGIYKLSAIGKIIPGFLSDQIYDAVSRNRMKLANQKCYLPTQMKEKNL